MGNVYEKRLHTINFVDLFYIHNQRAIFSYLAVLLKFGIGEIEILLPVIIGDIVFAGANVISIQNFVFPLWKPQ